MEIDIKELIKQVGKDASDETIKVLKDNESLLRQLSREELTNLFHYITVGSVQPIDGIIYTALLRGLTNDEFVAIRDKTKNSIKVWEDINTKKSKVVGDIVDKITKIAADVIFRQVVMSSLK